MYRYVQQSETEAWIPVRSDDFETRLKELAAKKATILEVSDLVPDEGDRRIYAYRGPLYFDIDCKQDLKLAIESGIRLAEKLVELGVPTQGVRAYASGSKGVHITVDQRYFSSGRAIKGLPLVYKAMAKELYVPGMDFQVYCCGRGNSFRVPNVQRKDGRYRVPITMEELLALTPERYLELVSTPRNLAIMEPTPVKAVQLEILFEEARKEVNSVPPQTIIVSSRETLEEIAKDVPPCVQQMCDWKGVRSARNLNQVAMQLGVYLARVPVSDVVADGLISRLADNAKSSKYETLRGKLEHVRGQVAYMQSNEGYHFSCPTMRSMLEKPPCRGCSIENRPEAGNDAAGILGLAERDEGMYLLTGKSEKWLTNFKMTPTDHYVEIPKDGSMPRRVGTKIELHEKEELVTTIMFSESSWLSRSAFMRDTTEGHGVLMFFGTDNDVQKIKGLVLNKEKSMGEIYRVHTAGIHMEKLYGTEVYTYVEPDMSINSNRIQGTYEMAGEIIARPYFAHASVAAPRDATVEQAILAAFSMNRPENLARIIGWLCACHLKVQLMACYGQFPILSVWGSAGSGKSKTSELLCWLNGTDYSMRDTPVNISSITKFAILDYASSTTTVPRILEEYNKSKMNMATWNAVGEIVKASWNGETMLRGTLAESKREQGRTGAKVVKIPISSPLLVVSEQELEMPALQERSLRVKLSKDALAGREEEHQMLLDNRDALRQLGKAMMAKSLQISTTRVKEMFAATQDIPRVLDVRPRYCHQVAAMGLDFLAEVLGDLQMPTAQAAAVELRAELVAFITKSSTSAVPMGARSEIDAVLEEMDIMAGLSNAGEVQWLVKGMHYLILDGGRTLAIDPLICHAIYKKYSKSSSHQRVVIESAKQFLVLLRDERYYAGEKVITGIASGRTVALLDREKMSQKGVDTHNFD